MKVAAENYNNRLLRGFKELHLELLLKRNQDFKGLQSNVRNIFCDSPNSKNHINKATLYAFAI